MDYFKLLFVAWRGDDFGISTVEGTNCEGGYQPKWLVTIVKETGLDVTKCNKKFEVHGPQRSKS